jgi:hypothetical protein
MPKLFIQHGDGRLDCLPAIPAPLHAPLDQDPSEPAASIGLICAPHHETDDLITQADGQGLPVLPIAAQGQVVARLGNKLALGVNTKLKSLLITELKSPFFKG